MSQKNCKSQKFNDVLIEQMDEYTNKAFATDNAEQREQYREIVKAMQNLFVLLCKVE